MFHSKDNWERYDQKCKLVYLLFLSKFNETWIFSTDCWKMPKYQIFMKIHPLGAELFHADGRTDIMKLIVAFRSFANAPKKGEN
jgi:hypothetical protein